MTRFGAEAYDPDFSGLSGGANVAEYGRFQQHLVLLEDERRLSAYFDAIDAARLKNSGTVVEVGGGTGVLTLYALKREYSDAVVFEPSRKIAHYARYLFNENGVGERVRIVEKALEFASLHDLPSKFDLLITETTSSVIFGFGSWDRLGGLIARLTPIGSSVPFSGKLYAALSEKSYATRNNNTGGLKMLAARGLKVDLFSRAFRSGGNVFDAASLRSDLETGAIDVGEIASFRLMNGEAAYSMRGCIRASRTAVYCGITVFWDISLSAYAPSVRLSSLDESLTSWYPYYISFIKPQVFEVGHNIRVELELSRRDAPYPYAFRILIDNCPVTNRLYW